MHIGIMQDSVNSVEGNYNDAVHLYTTDYWDGHYDDYGNEHLVSNGIIARIYVRPNYNRNVNPSITWFSIDNTTMTNTTFEARVSATDDGSVSSVNVNAWVSGTNVKIKPDKTPYYDSSSGAWIAKYTISRLPNALTGSASIICVEATATDNTGKTSETKALYNIPVGGVETGLGDFTTRIVPKGNTNFAIDISGSGNNSALKLKNKNTSRKEQLWKFTKVGGKYYEISNVTVNGKVITAKSKSEDNGTLLVLYDDNNAGHARFFLQKYNDGYRIIPNHTGFVRALDFNSYVDGKDIILWDNGNTWTNGAQTFIFEKVAESISLNKTSTTIVTGTSETLVANITPTDVAIKTLSWSSSNTSVATVDNNGKVTAKTPGTSTITVKTTDGTNLSKTCTVTVLDDTYDPNAKLTLSKDHYQFESVNTTVQLDAKLSTGKLTSITWSSSNTAVATVNENGLVTAKRGGFSYIKATSNKYGTLECLVYVNFPVNLSDGSKAYVGDLDGNGVFDVNDSSLINEIFKTEQNTSDNKLLADIDNNGIIDANDASLMSDIYRKEWFSIGNLATIRKVIISRNSLEMAIGEVYTLYASVNPSNTQSSKTITWSSSNSSIAAVDSVGKVTAKATGTITITARSVNGKTATCTINVVAKKPSVKYTTHVQQQGWQEYSVDGAMSGTSGKGLRLEGIKIKLENTTGGIEYRTHIQGIGWESSWKANDVMSGTSGKGLRLEAIQIKLTGEIVNNYDVYYCVHAQGFGWLNWAKNGESAGTQGYAKRLEGIKIIIIRKGEAAPEKIGTNEKAFVKYTPPEKISYTTHVQGIGWQSYVSNGTMSGTSGRGLRLEGIKIKLENISGGVEYRTHIQSIGWENSWKSNDAMSGTSGRGLRLEAIQIKLTGEAESKYDVYYRVHAQGFGWLGWAKNGKSAGTAGYAKRLEGIEIKLVKKGETAPVSTNNAFKQK